MNGKIFILDTVGDITTFVVDGVLLVKVSDIHGGAAIHALGPYTGKLQRHKTSDESDKSMEDIIAQQRDEFERLTKKR